MPNLFFLTTIKTIHFLLTFSLSLNISACKLLITLFSFNFMSFFQMGFPPKKDAIGRKSTSIESTEMITDGGDESGAADFWPVQHPIAPPQGDKPVECPFPNSSLINEWRFSKSSHRRAAEPMSKRRHSVSHEGDHYKRLLFPDKSHFLKHFHKF